MGSNGGFGRFLRSLALAFAVNLGIAVSVGPAAANGTDAPAIDQEVLAEGDAAAPQDADEPAPSVPRAWQWRITKDSWSDSDERGFGEFVRAIGESDCRTVNACLRHEANVYRYTDPKNFRFFADCADFPYFLRAYYAWKNGLPFAYASSIRPAGFSRDFRYSRYGNIVTSRAAATAPAEGRWPNALTFIQEMTWNVSSAMYRYHPEQSEGLPTDHYSIRLDPRSVRAGTVIYDPNGHLAIVYKVERDGRILYIDSHPDNSVTRGVYGKKFVRARPEMGAGFKNWRPLRLVGARRLPDGSLVGGRLVYAANDQIPDFDTTQYFGTAQQADLPWHEAAFVHEGQEIDYYDFVRHAVADENFVYDPLEETRNMMRSICDDLRYRVHAVDEAIANGIHEQAQPDQLPENIYGTNGLWETYSTPSRDARLKVSFRELFDQVKRFVGMVEGGVEQVNYAGSDIAGDLLKVYEAEAANCTITYTRSNGEPMTLAYGDLVERLYRLSFDPYHCAERRWGANSDLELVSCPDGWEKSAWYAAEQRLRNQHERTYDARMDLTLAELNRGVEGSGVDAAKDVDVKGYLLGLMVARGESGGSQGVASLEPDDCAEPKSDAIC